MKLFGKESATSSKKEAFSLLFYKISKKGDKMVQVVLGTRVMAIMA